MTIGLTWTNFRQRIDGTVTSLAYQEQSTDTYYRLTAANGPVVYTCLIFKSVPPGGDQSQHEIDRAEYEADFQASADATSYTGVKIQETSLTDGMFQGIVYYFNAPANSLKEVDFTLDHDIDLLAGRYYNDNCQAGDGICLQVRIGIVGTIEADAAVNATVLNVSSTVTDNVNIGHWISIGSERACGASLSEYLVTDKDATAGTLTVLRADRSGGLSEAYTSGQYIYLIVKMTIARNESGYQDRMPCIPGMTFEFGREKVGGSGIPAAKRIRIGFENTHATNQRMVTVHLPNLY